MENKTRILLWDIETSHMIVASFGLWNQNISPNHIIKDWTIFCGAWKFLGEDKVYSASVADMPEEEVVRLLRNAVSEADLIIGHNADKFDIKKLRTRMIHYGMLPESPTTSLDTLKVCKSEFGFSSNRLDYVCKFLGLEGKTATSEGLWLAALAGGEAAVRDMVAYNENDVTILEAAYLKLRPYIKNHPHVGRLMQKDRGSCNKCGYENLQIGASPRATKTRIYDRLYCPKCGGWQIGNVIKEMPRESLHG